jgi:DNA segregation ATPase FtsK/SpoIIIE, S-DNA-T family
MSTVVITRAQRAPGPPLPQGEVELQEPPALPELDGGGFRQAMTVLPMLGASSGTLLTFSQPNSGPLTYLGGGMMALSMGGMFLGQLGQRSGDRKAKMKGERRDYLRYLTQLRKQVRKAARQHREAVVWDHPDPSLLWTVASGRRVWERRPGHGDFADVRVGLGDQRSLLRMVPPQTKPVEDLDPLCASALRRFIRAYTVVSAVPTVLHLPAFSTVALAGDRDRTRGLATAVLAQLATMHSPDDLQIAVLAAPDRVAHWQWLKWLPHALHPQDRDAAGPVRLWSADYRGLAGLLGPRFEERPSFQPDAGPGPGEPFLVVVNDGVPVAEDCRLVYGGLRNVVELRLAEDTAADGDPGGPAPLRLRLADDRLEVADADGVVIVPDRLDPTGAETLARVLAPLRTGGITDVAEPLNTTFDLTKLLGIPDARGYDVHSLWRSRARGGLLRVPVGVGADGSVVELDIKESAQGGMGPHGVLIGATGSGKSELLRTLVIALAATHSSEILNFVLTDFKGGATFMGMDALPHTSAVITNLADELPLVDRMQDALHGELIRRQELLRRAGHSSLRDYEKARADGADLEPLPTLFIVVDEFSELLSGKPEFMELFVMIGRLGRSLGVHLLLASQRLEEGRIHALESHLSYRIALRTFSASESRSVIGVSDAYELPPGPGNGFLKMDTTTLVRFKASYVSGPYQSPRGPSGLEPTVELGVEPLELAYRAPKLVVPDRTAQPEPAAGTEDADQESLFEVLIGRLRGQGPPARQVWLPPLAESPSLDQLLPGLVPDPGRGLSAVDWPGCGELRVPVGVVDRPFEQLRDLLVADLGAAAGHVGVVGGTQSGKSTLLRSLLLSLALTHTPAEVQFYCLDFGGGSLAGLAGLPHLGSVATRLDRDRVTRTLAEMVGLMRQREQRFVELGVESMAAYRQMRRDGRVTDPYGDVFLVVDGWFTLRQDFDDLEGWFTELAARGLGYGVHLVVTAGRWSDIRPWLRDVLGTRFELRLGDTIDSEIGSRAAAGVPDGHPGRGLTRDAFHFLAAQPRADGGGSADLATATKSLVAEIAAHWTGSAAPDVRLLPAELPVEQLPPPDGDLRVALGWDEQALQPVWHDFDQTPHLMVFGDNETGKTNLLRVLVRAVRARYAPDQAKILLADFRRELHDEVPPEYRVGYAVTSGALGELCASAGVSLEGRMPGPEITPDQLRRRDWWQGPKLFVVVDDYDLAVGGHGGPLEPLVPYLAQGADVGLHLLLARSSSGAMRGVMDPAIRRMWELGNPGLLLSYPKEEGKFLGEARPLRLPPGRAQLVTRRSVTLVQTALAALPDRKGA